MSIIIYLQYSYHGVKCVNIAGNTGNYLFYRLLERVEMDWEIEFNEVKGIIFIKTSGNMTGMEENREMISEVLALGKKNGVTKYLIDNRNRSTKLGIAAIYYLPETFGDIGIKHEHKVAIVLRDNLKEYETHKFYETRASNLGYEHRIFIDPDVALDWLMDRQING